MYRFNLRVLLLLVAALAISQVLPPSMLAIAGSPHVDAVSTLNGRGCGGTKRLLSVQLASTHPAITLAGVPHAAETADGSRTWESDADFLGGYFERTEVVSGSGRISLARSWSAASRINPGSPASRAAPQLALDANGVLYSAWLTSTAQIGTILVASSLDGGQTWDPGAQANRGKSAWSVPALAVDAAGALHAAWIDGRDGSAAVYTARSLDGGQTWDTDVRADGQGSPVAGGSPALKAAPDGTLYLAWQDTRKGDPDIYIARSLDGGKTWGAGARANDDDGAAAQSDPTLVVGEGGELYLAWQDTRKGDPDIYTARSLDNGKTWSVNVRANDDDGAAVQSDPCMVPGLDKTLYMVWQDARGGESDIYMARSLDSGQSWEPNVRVNQRTAADGSSNVTPSLTVSADGLVYVLWGREQAQDSDIYLAYSPDGGTTWSAAEPLGDHPNGQRQELPALIADSSGKLYAAWYDERDGDGGLYGAHWPDSQGVFTEGTYTSAVHDAGLPATWGNLTWAAGLPVGTGVTISARSGDKSGTSIAWSGWYTFTVSPAELTALPPARYFQWRARLTTQPGQPTPTLDTLTLTWENRQRRGYLPLVLR